MKNLKGKTAIITGGASGIGLGITEALLDAGMNVAIGDVQADALDAVRRRLGETGRLVAAPLDVTDRQGFANFADRVEEHFGQIHLLINNAGVVVSGPVEDASFSDWDWVLNVNLVGAINGLVTVLPRILSHDQGGHIVNTASTSGLLPHPGAAIYVTTKSALIGMTEAMRPELEAKGVIASVLCPGPVQSQITSSARNRPASYKSSGYNPVPSATADLPGDVTELLMNPRQVGEIVREGIERDYLYIITHSEYRQGLDARAQAIAAALPDRPENDTLKRCMAATLQNPAHLAEIARHKYRG